MINIISPKHGATVSLHTDEQKKFVADTHKRETAQADAFDYLNLVVVAADRTCPAPVVFSWSLDCGSGEYVLEILEAEDFDDKLEIYTAETEAGVYNLKAGMKYYFRVKTGLETSHVCAFYTDCQYSRAYKCP